jgi:hypothetical protein
MARPPTKILLLLVLAVACGGARPADPTTTSPPATPTTASPAATPSTTPGDEEITASTDTAPTSTDAIEGHPARAHGSGTVRFNGEDIDVEIYACGWIISTTDPLHPGEPYSAVVYAAEPGRSANFYVAALAPGGTPFFEIAITRNGDVGGLRAFAVASESGDPLDAAAYANGLLPASTLEVTDNRFQTTEPLPLRNPVTYEKAAVEFSGVCDAMGGSQETSGQAAADIAGLQYEVFSTGVCVALDEGANVQVNAASDESEIHIKVADQPEVQALAIQDVTTGEVWQRFGPPGEFLTSSTGSVSTNGRISIEEALGTVSQVELAIVCS